MDSSLPRSSVHGILQARILEWVTRSHSSWIQIPALAHYKRTLTNCPTALFSCFCAVLSHLVIQSCLTLCDSMDCSLPGFSVQGEMNSCPGKNTGVGCHALFQGIFPTQISNPGLPPCRQILYCLSHQGSPWIPEWVAYTFSRGYSQPRNQNRVSCIASRFFSSWATMETLSYFW